MKLLIVATILVIWISLSECKPAVDKLDEHDLERPYFADLLDERLKEFNKSNEQNFLGSLKTNLKNIEGRLKHREHNSDSRSSDSGPIDY